MASVYEREFTFTPKDFEYIRDMVGERTGIVLSEHKVDMVYGRLARRLRQLKISNFRDYLALLTQDDDQELVEFTNALTTNLTSFFREPHHFEFLQQKGIPELLKRRPNKRLRVWSAGCSTGEEPYTIAITLQESVPLIRNWDIKILATDLDSNVVRHAKEGVYNQERVNGISKERLSRWFNKGHGGNQGKVRVSSDLHRLVTFKQLNLMHEWPMKGPFDVIFCRNVVIYFNKDTQRTLFERYADILADDGYLIVGHSESLHKVTDRFELLGKTIYRKAK
ncbi:MAG: methyltransferase domain-containing protein [Gammaproteobacteria bacterium]|nr:methyltransferase domain-containing protein [Gammaproteobacteria bacterium]